MHSVASEDFLRSGELAAFLLGVVVALIAVAVFAFVVRNRVISRGHTAFLVAVKQGHHFRLGQAQLTASSIRWYGMRSLSPRPSMVWYRGDLELGPPSAAPGASLSLTDAVRVTCRVGGDDVDITMNSGDYTALRSWSESAPPGIHADVA